MQKKKISTNKLLTWFDRNGLVFLAGFLILFIPLYPKLPLLDAIPGYIVRIRLEDILILFTFVLWGIQLWRGKVKLHPLITKLVLVYLVVGLLSTLSALFITQTVPLSLVHIAKLYLHYFRRIEYFSLFFIFFSAITSLQQAKKFILLLTSSMIVVALYGFGQKYLYWPVYSTMNREFAKGWRLYLTEHARVPSTFGGHYDAAAFTMIVITIALALVLMARRTWIRLLALIAYVLGFYLLILTASRTSFIAFLVAMQLVFLGLLFFQRRWAKTIVAWLVVMSFTVITALYSSDFVDRFEQVPGVTQLISFRDNFHFKLYDPKIDKPKDYMAANELAQVTSVTDEPPTPNDPREKTDASLPPDVYENIPLPVAVLDEEGNETGEYALEERTYSDAAHTHGLSAAIRYDTLWPRALAGLKQNPLLGSGYATLTKESVEQFTEAESTDNEFLRTLGETGILGFISFFGVVVMVMLLSLKGAVSTQDWLFKAYLIGFVAASAGLLVNAAYIDVFTASKVAEVYWALAGVALAISALSVAKKTSS